MLSHFLMVMLKEEIQPKIMNEHAIIDYANVITVWFLSPQIDGQKIDLQRLGDLHHDNQQRRICCTLESCEHRN